MVALHKVSSPSFTHEFAEHKQVIDDLRAYVCSRCIRLMEHDLHTDGLSFSTMSEIEQLGELLATSCGAEFTVDEPTQRQIYITNQG